MKPEIINAVIKSVPDYFSWESLTKEAYRANISDDVLFSLKKHLINKLFGILVTNENQLERTLREFSEAQYLQLNSQLLYMQGIGEDYFYLNESFVDNTSILDFKSLYDYDYDDFCFQEADRKKRIPDYKSQRYRGSLHFTWARLFIDESFSYANLSMKAYYILNEISEFSGTLIDELIPSEIKRGSRKKLSGGYGFELIKDAKGLEGQLDELNARVYRHQDKIFNRLAKMFEKDGAHEVIIISNDNEIDPVHDFIFSDGKILKKINLKTFVKNCRMMEQKDHSGLFAIIDNEKESLEQVVQSEYKDVMKNFDPKTNKFKKRKKIIVHEDSGLM